MVKTWQYDLANKCIGDQLVRAATSVAANYRAARRSRSDREFLAKMSIVVEEVDESLFWLSLAIDAQCVSVEKAGLLRDEAEQLLKIFASTRATLKRRGASAPNHPITKSPN